MGPLRHWGLHPFLTEGERGAYAGWEEEGRGRALSQIIQHKVKSDTLNALQIDGVQRAPQHCDG